VRCFRVRPGFRLARSTSPPIVTLRAFHAERRPALLWTRLPPINFCNCNHFFRCVGTTTSTRFSRTSLRAPRVGDLLSSPSVSAAVSPTADFPLRRSLTRAASRDSPSDYASTTLQARREIRLRKLPPSLDVACGRRPNPTITCGDGCWDGNAGLHGPRSLERRTFLSRALLPQEAWVKVPLLLFLGFSSTPETVVSSPTLRAWGWILPTYLVVSRGPRSTAVPRRTALSRGPGCLPPPGTKFA